MDIQSRNTSVLINQKPVPEEVLAEDYWAKRPAKGYSKNRPYIRFSEASGRPVDIERISRLPKAKSHSAIITGIPTGDARSATDSQPI